MNSFEEYLQDKILPELENGRANFDKPHTIAVVEYIKAIVDNNPKLKLDKDVLIIAAYAHDWGYTGLFKEGKPLGIDSLVGVKEAHMKLGADKLRKLLKSSIFRFLSKGRKERAVHLVKIHDNFQSLKETDELVLMEADTLGGIDVEKTKPSFSKESNDRYMKGVKTKRFPLFITDYGKKEFERLYGLREEYYENT